MTKLNMSTDCSGQNKPIASTLRTLTQADPWDGYCWVGLLVELASRILLKNHAASGSIESDCACCLRNALAGGLGPGAWSPD
jgi:hypothetical protein